jgi:hypothetical protein
MPTQEKCVVHCSHGTCLYTVDVVTFIFICKTEGVKISITFYNSIQHNIKNKLVYALIHNQTFIIHEELRHEFDFYPELDTFVIHEFIPVNKTFMFLIFRNIHQGSNIKQRCILPVTGKLVTLATNNALGIKLMGSQALKSHLFGFEIGFVQKPFDLSIENHPLRKLHIEIQRQTAGEVKQILPGKVTIDNQRNILLIHRKKDQRGNSLYDGINAYTSSISTNRNVINPMT